ncbi:LapA family protein [Propioniciclava soli]|uniref:LapA family protein n=1 Tax=Propioniciclava soli TaxID=2775081 RepID=A0ABZ3C4C4_9ACTN|nr:LapA family protein [Propioniciclava soli]
MTHLLGLPILQTLPGWPEAYTPTLMDMLWLVLIIPFGIGAVFTLFILGPTWFRRSHPSTELERS